MQYRMILQTTEGHLGWEYNYDIADDKMAVSYAVTHIRSFANCDWLQSILVFNITTEPTEKLLAVVTLGRQPVEVEYKPG